MFKFKNKEHLSDKEKNIIKQLVLFYSMYGNIFVDFSNASEKRDIIKKVYEILHYNDIPKLLSTLGSNLENYIIIYRGISASDSEDLKKYVNQFIYGDVFYGGRASLYGTGIYTVICNDSNVAQKYASDGNANNNGIVIESRLDKECKIIQYRELEHMKDVIFDKMRKMYKKDIEKFLAVLDDDGVLAAILGYDAIYVEEKGYVVVLNRTKMIVNDIDLFNQLNLIDNIKNR